MGTDPDPVDPALDGHPERPVVRSDANGPKITYPLEVKRGMARVGLEELIVLISKIANADGKASYNAQNRGEA